MGSKQENAFVQNYYKLIYVKMELIIGIFLDTTSKEIKKNEYQQTVQKIGWNKTLIL